jgi:hypothetical protein
MGGDDRREVGERNLPDKPDALDAGVVDEDASVFASIDLKAAATLDGSVTSASR